MREDFVRANPGGPSDARARLARCSRRCRASIRPRSCEPSALLRRGAGGRRAIPAPSAARPCFADSSAFTWSSRSRSASAQLGFLLRAASRVALDRGQILVDLRQLIPQRGGFAQQPQHLLAGGFDAMRSRSRSDLLKLRRARPSSRASRCARGFGLLRRVRPRLRDVHVQFAARLLLQTFADAPAVSVSPCARRCSMAPICLACDSSRPRVRSASRLQLGQRWRGGRSARLPCDSGCSSSRVCSASFSVTCAGERLEFGAGLIQIERQLRGLALQHPEAAGQATCADAPPSRSAVLRSASPWRPAASANSPGGRLLRECRTRATDSASRLRASLRPAASWF